MKLSLDELVTSVATDLMGITAPTLNDAAQRLLHQLVDYLDVDLSFLRRNDHSQRTTTLVAEWPPRTAIPVPDPLGVISFADADPIFAATENLSTVMLTRPDGTDDEYQSRVQRGAGLSGPVSSATVPLLNASRTMGVLGFIKYGDREWHDAEVQALRSVAALFAQVQLRVVAEERLVSLAFHDELTGLANRRALVGQLTERMDAAPTGPVAVIFLDVDRLKVVNSFLGHAAGDQYRHTMARRLQKITGADHLLGRLGGDEFVAVMSGWADENAAVALAERLRCAAHEPIDVGGEEISRGVSLGVAIGTPGHQTVSELMGRADQALLQSKARGGNTVSVFTAGMQRRNAIRTDIELHLGTAIRSGCLTLHYLPEVDLLTGNILGMEALVRWPHPTLGLLEPDSLLDVVESTNLAGKMGRWVIETACRQLAQWHLTHPALRLTVNVSPAQLIGLDFGPSVAQILQDCALEGGDLTVDITERGLSRDTDQAVSTLRGLRATGVKVAVDDFGTGHSSFAQLKSYPVDALKISRVFVRDLGASADDLAIVRSITSLARSFGLQVVATGVETEVAAATLVALGCTRAQGFLFAKPCPAPEVESILENGIAKFGKNGPVIR